MKDQKLAGELAQSGFDHLKSGRYKEAEACYSQALELAEANNWAVVEYCDEFAQVLESLGKAKEARIQLENSLKIAINISEKITDYEVTLARHMLAEHLIKNGTYHEALNLVKPFLGKGCDNDWLLYLSAASAFQSIGDHTGAKISALAVLTKVPGDARENVERQLAEYLE